jgi:MarR family transcriptional regulator, temperature-dependent positive regulator of motility
LRGLGKKGLVRRDVDTRCPGRTPLRHRAGIENLQHLHEAWSRALEGIVDGPETIEFVNATLRCIENELTARRRRAGNQRAQDR